MWRAFAHEADDPTMSSKQIKIIVAIVVLAVAGILAYRSMNNGPDLPTSSGFVCVETGEVFEMALDDVAIIPGLNPNTGRRTLLPCSRGEDGRYHVSEYYRGSLTGSLNDVNKYVDVQSLEVKTKDGN